MSDPKLPPWGRTKLAAGITAGVLALATPAIIFFEGTVPKVYRDPVGILTSCTGHTGPELVPGQVFTKEECAQQLQDDLLKHAQAIDCIRVEVPDHVKAAVLSWAFNVGNRAACTSTMMAKLNAGDTMGACAELARWTLSKGRELPGLVKRRFAERALCEGRLSELQMIPQP